MSKVAVLRTSPASIVKDYGRLMDLVEYRKIIGKKQKTIVKLNLSWTLYYPACSTQPWQLEGLLSKMHGDGYERITGVENQTVVTHPWKGAHQNKWLPVLKKFDVEFKPLTDVKWIPFKPKFEMLAMNEIFESKKEDILIPKMFLNTNMVHLPTIKTHGHTVMTGAMKNAFGGLIPKYRHHAHKNIHEILVDLLAIQKEIHKGIISVTDGTVCGNGAGPRTMEPFTGNIILASDDQVAIDAISAKIMGFEPLKIPFIKLAHDNGLGTGDLDQIEILGMNRKRFKKLNFGFKTKRSPIIKWDQRLRKGTYGFKPLHNLLFHSTFFKLFVFASEFYHDRLWYPTLGKRNIQKFSETGWGQLFNKYKCGRSPKYKEIREWDPY